VVSGSAGDGSTWEGAMAEIDSAERIASGFLKAARTMALGWMPALWWSEAEMRKSMLAFQSFFSHSDCDAEAVREWDRIPARQPGGLPPPRSGGCG